MCSIRPRVFKLAVIAAMFALMLDYCFAGRAVSAQQLSQTTQSQTPQLSLAEIERMALQNNPTLAQAEAAIQAARGRSRQAGAFPNPVAGYQGEEFAFRAFNDKSEHLFFLEQTIPLGGKLSKSRRVFEQEIVRAETESMAQKQRVLNTVRMLYYDALGAERRVELRSELARVAREATRTTSELLNVGQADRPDFLESEIEAQRVELELANAQNDREQIWRVLAPVIGMPAMEPARLAGDLEADLPKLEWTMENGVKVFHLSAEVVKREFLPASSMGPAKVVDVWDYNGSMPGPTIEVNEGDHVRIMFHNNLPEDTTIHWHGLEVPLEMDGTPYISQPMVKPGGVFFYEFTLNQNGTFFYHSHGAMQEMMGQIGLFIIHPKKPHTPVVHKDFGLILQEWPCCRTTLSQTRWRWNSTG